MGIPPFLRPTELPQHPPPSSRPTELLQHPPVPCGPPSSSNVPLFLEAHRAPPASPLPHGPQLQRPRPGGPELLSISSPCPARWPWGLTHIPACNRPSANPPPQGKPSPLGHRVTAQALPATHHRCTPCPLVQPPWAPPPTPTFHACSDRGSRGCVPSRPHSLSRSSLLTHPSTQYIPGPSSLPRSTLVSLTALLSSQVSEGQAHGVNGGAPGTWPVPLRALGPQVPVYTHSTRPPYGSLSPPQQCP